MRPNTAPERVPDDPVRVEFEVRFSRGPKGRRRVREAPEAREPWVETPTPQTKTDAAPNPAPLDPSRVPRITRLLVLGHHFERLVHDGVVKDYAEIARLTGLSRARVTQIVNLTLLAPQIQEQILCAVDSHPERNPAEKYLRLLPADVAWGIQVRVWENLDPSRLAHRADYSGFLQRADRLQRTQP